jgi:hypothetical protein
MLLYIYGMNTKNIIIGTSLLAVSGFGIWAYRKKTFGDKIVIINDIKVKVTGRTFGVPSALQLAVTPTIKNPTTVQATITQPFVELRLDKTDIDAFATSQAANTRHKIEPLSETKLDAIFINISLTDLVMKFPAIIKSAIKNKKLSLFAKTSCYLVTGTTLKLKVEQEDESTVNL